MRTDGNNNSSCHSAVPLSELVGQRRSWAIPPIPRVSDTLHTTGKVFMSGQPATTLPCLTESVVKRCSGFQMLKKWTVETLTTPWWWPWWIVPFGCTDAAQLLLIAAECWRLEPLCAARGPSLVPPWYTVICGRGHGWTYQLVLTNRISSWWLLTRLLYTWSDQ